MDDLSAAFDNIRERLRQVEAQLGDGVVLSDARRLADLTREHSRLKGQLEQFDLWKNSVRELADTEALLSSLGSRDEEMRAMAGAEREGLLTRVSTLHLACQSALLPPDPHEGRDVILEIRAGTGGSEAALFAADLHRMYSRFIEAQTGWKIELLSASPSDLGGLREVISMVSSPDAYRMFQFESGVHRVQRVPLTEAQGRIHTSTATVAVLPEAREVDVQIKPEELRIEVCRSGGPGGQGVNTTDSAVQVLHIPTGLIVRCQDSRSQIKNRERAMSILRSRLLERRQAEEDAAYAARRRGQVGSGDRNEKIRTYNFPQNRVTDHRINCTLYNLAGFMEGEIKTLLDALLKDQIEKRLAALRQ